jgi:hypothetical protein
MASDGFQHKSAFSFFVSRVRQNLHVILSMDPSNPDYDMRCASNPALFAACSVLWMETWSLERMQVCPDSCFCGILFLDLIAFEVEGDHAIYVLLGAADGKSLFRAVEKMSSLFLPCFAYSLY